jgi:hypothetical protein
VCVCGDERSDERGGEWSGGEGATIPVVMAVGDSDRRKSINPQVEVEPPIQETYISVVM